MRDLSSFHGVDHADTLHAPQRTPVPVEIQTTVGNGQQDLLERYFNMLAGEDVVVAPDSLLRQVIQQINAAASRPQTSTIINLVTQIQELGACKPEQLTGLSAQLDRELAKSDSQLHSEIEGEEDDFFARLGTSLDSVYG